MLHYNCCHVPSLVLLNNRFQDTASLRHIYYDLLQIHIGLSVLNNPKDISVCADLENKKIIVSAADVAEDHTAFLEDLFHSMNWNPEYQYRLLGEKHNDQLHFQLESVMVKQEKD